MVTKSLLGYHTVNDRILSVRIHGKVREFTIIQAYAPTSSATEEEREQYFHSDTAQNSLQYCPWLSAPIPVPGRAQPFPLQAAFFICLYSSISFAVVDGLQLLQLSFLCFSVVYTSSCHHLPPCPCKGRLCLVCVPVFPSLPTSPNPSACPMQEFCIFPSSVTPSVSTTQSSFLWLWMSFLFCPITTNLCCVIAYSDGVALLFLCLLLGL